ncbi:hypothetical protein ES332_D10G127400v1 [Gossypium tomentosum]|uniref:Uncharacterized protein n=1 Tax=Gossypium tomentosum TaxID=34277 RepID=A0A5D2J4X0_GOSTO|nr:hypothetical protein ES332_D10G127400v1 [Gossypium tomentosum]
MPFSFLLLFSYFLFFLDFHLYVMPNGCSSSGKL